MWRTVFSVVTRTEREHWDLGDWRGNCCARHGLWNRGRCGGKASVFCLTGNQTMHPEECLS